ncbi:MAG: hypothetical protein NTY01_09250 [Verrucomicrobia bacterium]|nr:hypothetical protein [Verrucomicrobiota bacterium]
MSHCVIQKAPAAKTNGKHPAPLEERLARYVRQQEAAGEFKHYANPADFVAELKARRKSSRHALRTVAA